MAYRCDQAIITGARDAIRCKVSGTVCAHQKMCMMEGRLVLTDGAMRCPARDGQLPGEIPERKAVAVKAAARQTATRTGAAAKTTRARKPATQDDTDAAKKQRTGTAKGKASGKTTAESAAKKQQARKA